MEGHRQLKREKQLLRHDSKCDGETSQPTQAEIATPGDAFTKGIEPEVWHPPEQVSKGDISFQASKWRTQANMDTLSKGKMTIHAADDIQLIRLCELCLVVICRD